MTSLLQRQAWLMPRATQSQVHRRLLMVWLAAVLLPLAAVVMEAAEASGVDLKRAARDAAFRAEAEASGSGSRSTAKRP